MCWDPSLKLLLPLRRMMSGKAGKGAQETDLSQLLLRVRLSLFYIVDLFLGQWFNISFSQVMPNLLLEFPEEMTYRLGWRLMVRWFRRISGIVPYHSLFSPGWKQQYRWCRPYWGYLGLFLGFFIQSTYCLYCFSCTQFRRMQSEREWVEDESVDKDYPQKTILEIHFCNHQYPLRTSSQNIVFIPGELSGASRNRYVFASCQFRNTFLGNPESVRRRSVENTGTYSKTQCL